MYNEITFATVFVSNLVSRLYAHSIDRGRFLSILIFWATKSFHFLKNLLKSKWRGFHISDFLQKFQRVIFRMNVCELTRIHTPSHLSNFFVQFSFLSKSLFCGLTFFSKKKRVAPEENSPCLSRQLPKSTQVVQFRFPWKAVVLPALSVIGLSTVAAQKNLVVVEIDLRKLLKNRNVHHQYFEVLLFFWTLMRTLFISSENFLFSVTNWKKDDVSITEVFPKLLV